VHRVESLQGRTRRHRDEDVVPNPAGIQENIWRIPTNRGIQSSAPGTFGIVSVRCRSALEQATEAAHIYIYIFGDTVWHFDMHGGTAHFGRCLGRGSHTRRV
jgi:hypothetical protein